MAVATLIIGLALGAAGVWLALRSRVAELRPAAGRLLEAEKELASARATLEAEQRASAEKLALLDDAKKALANEFRAQSAEALRSNNSSFLEQAAQLVKPLKESLEKVDGQFRTLDQTRSALVQQLHTLQSGQETLSRATGSLATALRTPHVRGRWGEVQLKNVVEAAGLVEHCDFVLQATTRDGEGALLRPDLVVRLPGAKQVVVDAKVPLSAYLDACECDDDATRAHAMKEHARQLRDHVGKLSAKAYWRQFEPTPDFVIMFLPDESFLRAAQEHDSTIIEYAWASNVIPASPTNLFALLRTVAATWQQETVAQSAREVHLLGQELYDRLVTMAGHVSQLGRSLSSAVGHYNKTVGTLETRVLVTGRKLEEHGIKAGLPELAPIEAQTRPLAAPELVEAAESAPRALPAA
jgi:DNA recombination protein RmuC